MKMGFFARLIAYAVLFFAANPADAATSITVKSDYKKELNIKIQGAGVGGCDVTIKAGEQNVEDCWCLWGTVNYSFCAYGQSPIGSNATASDEVPGVSSGRCPIITGESLLCSDLSSLGNCYDKSYACNIDSSGFCHCITV